MVAALAAMAGGVITFCSAAHIIIPYSAEELVGMGGGLLAVYGGTSYLVRRLKAGNDPLKDSPKVTMRNGHPGP